MTENSSHQDTFKQAQVRYRRDPSKPDRIDDLPTMVDFSRADSRIRLVQQEGDRGEGDHDVSDSEFSNGSCYRGPLYTLDGFGGFLYAPGALSNELQLQLAYQAVCSYCERPHKTNIDLVRPKTTEIDNSSMSTWELWKHEHGISSRFSSEGHLPPTLRNDLRFYKSFQKLAWATMGYSYDWTARVYHEDDWSPIPTDLIRLSQYFAAAETRYRRFARKSELRDTNGRHLGPSECDKPSDLVSTDPFEPSACIVNYYNSKSVMGGHRDDSEYAVHQPIVSFSTGRPAVFLLGGRTRDDPVAPIVVRPGDVMMLGGSARLNYHAMARLLPNDALPLAEPHRAPPTSAIGTEFSEAPPLETRVPESERLALDKFLESHRINVNVRQVYP